MLNYICFVFSTFDFIRIYTSITHFRFNEECTEVEEEVCKTVYDEVWEKKCEMVNITLPQTDCKEFTETQMETK